MNLNKFWSDITNIGVDRTELGEHVAKVRLLNQLVFFALLVTILTMPTYFIFFTGWTQILVDLGSMCFMMFSLYLAYRKQHLANRFLASFVFPTYMAVAVVVLGGNFGEVNIFAASGLTAFILYENRQSIQVIAIAYITLLFMVSKLVVINLVREQDVKVNPYDEIITFPIVLIALGLIVLLYLREVRKFERQNLAIIQDLEEKNSALEEGRIQSDQFTYQASKDLKKPLRGIISNLDLVERHISQNNLQAINEDISYAKISSGKMYDLIQDILEFKRVGLSYDEIEVVDMNELMDGVIEQNKKLIEERGAEIHFEHLPSIRVVKQDFITLFSNLIENGLIFNHSPKPMVSIRMTQDTRFIRFHVKDNGIGIPVEYQQDIFQFFKRLHSDHEFKGAGNGLGLCQKIVEKYQGAIEVVSAPEQGSEFLITLSRNLLAELDPAELS
ncbi:MAG: ATP-binding protein [Bacteroidota bacterium]